MSAVRFILLLGFLLVIVRYSYQRRSTLQNNIFLEESEFLFLKEFYRNTNGPYWNRNHNWDFSNRSHSNPCIQLWEGIFVSYSKKNFSTCHIATITLPNNNLTGTLPEIISLPLLIYFFVSNNRFFGRLPTFNTTLLAALDLQGNSFSGSIPMDMIAKDQGRAISELHLNNNLLTGSFPDWIYSLSSLNSLHLQDNHLTGTLSSKIMNLRTLRHLFLGNNRFYGLIHQDVFKLQMLKTFNADNNFFSGTLPKSFNITSRSVFDLVSLEIILKVLYQMNILDG